MMKNFNWTLPLMIGVVAVLGYAILFQVPPGREVKREVPSLEKADTTRATMVRVHGGGFRDVVYVLTVDGEQYIVVRGSQCVAVCAAK